MTTEEAIMILNPETRRETMRKIPVFERIDADQAACRLAVTALRAQAEAEKNAPLTLEELRKLDGEPVWVTQPSDTLLPFWGLVNVEDETVSGNLYCATFEDYDTEWLAYRRKPEEAPAEEQRDPPTKVALKTNADVIRTMSTEELAEFLYNVHYFPCGTCCGNLDRCRRNNAPEPECRRHYLEWLKEAPADG